MWESNDVALDWFSDKKNAILLLTIRKHSNKRVIEDHSKNIYFSVYLMSQIEASVTPSWNKMGCLRNQGDAQSLQLEPCLPWELLLLRFNFSLSFKIDNNC